MMAGARKPGPEVQPLQDLTDGRPLLGEPAVDHADQVGLGFVNDEMAQDTVLTADITVSIGRAAGDDLTGTRPLQLAATEAFSQDGALIFGDRALDLEQELIVGIVGNGMVQEHDGAPDPAELLQQENLIGILASQAVGAQHANDFHGTIACGIAQAVQSRPIQAGAAEPLVPVDMILANDMAVHRGPGL
jgi:hypothetical protein